MVEFLNFLPPVVLAILAVIVVVFVIKSLIKFALIVGVIGVAIFFAWQYGLFSF